MKSLPNVIVAAILALLIVAPGCRRGERKAPGPAQPLAEAPAAAEPTPDDNGDPTGQDVAEEPGRILISGEAFLRERIALPGDASLVVRLVEVGTGGKVGREVAAVQAPPRRQPPISFEIVVNEEDLRTGANYALTAEITRRGVVAFKTDAPVPVVPQGLRTTDLRLLLRRVP